MRKRLFSATLAVPLGRSGMLEKRHLAELSNQCKPLSESKICHQMRVLSGRKRSPLGQGGRATLLVGLAIEKVAFGPDMIVERGVDRGEFLQCLYLAKSEHRPLSSSEGQMAVLSAVVQPPPYFPAGRDCRAGAWRPGTSGARRSRTEVVVR